MRCKASYFHIRALRHIRSSFITEACKTIAAAIIVSRLYTIAYCNSLLAGASFSNLHGSPTTCSIYTCTGRYRKISFLPHHPRSFRFASASCSPQNTFQDCYYITFKVCISNSHLISCCPHSTICVDRHDHCGLLPCQYVFPHENPQWQSPNHFHLFPHIFGTNCLIIFHPFPLFLLSGRDSSTTFFREPFLVIPHHLHWHHVLWCQPIHNIATQVRRTRAPPPIANAFQLSAYD